MKSVSTNKKSKDICVSCLKSKGLMNSQENTVVEDVEDCRPSSTLPQGAGCRLQHKLSVLLPKF